MTDPQSRNSEICRLYVDEGMNQTAIARRFKLSRARVADIIKGAGIQLRPYPALMEDAPQWKGGRLEVHDKERGSSKFLVYRPVHPRSNEQGYVFEHYLEAEECLGRPLTMTEWVFARDGDFHNTSCKNLDVCEQGSPEWKAQYHRYSDEELLEVLCWLAMLLERTPTTVEMDTLTPFYAATYWTHFGSYVNACVRVGLVPNSRGRGPAPELPKEFIEQYAGMGYFETADDLVNHLREVA